MFLKRSLRDLSIIKKKNRNIKIFFKKKYIKLFGHKFEGKKPKPDVIQITFSKFGDPKIKNLNQN